MNDHWATGALLAALILLNALFAGSEIAIISVREGQLRQLEQSGTKAARALLWLVDHPTRLLATIQLGITLSGFLASATAAVSLSRPLVPLLGFLGGLAEAAAIAVVTAVLTFLTLVFGELAPKRLAMQFPQRWALAAARPLLTLAVLSRPVVWALGAAADLTVRLVGGRPGRGRIQPTREELRELVAGHHGLHPEERAIITDALGLQGRRLRDIVTPRRKVLTLTSSHSVPVARAALVSSGHTRAPVSPSGRLDEISGVVELRDLLGEAGTVQTRARPPLLLPDTLGLFDALRRFRTEHEGLAVVMAEGDTVEGIVTLQDLLDEIVGSVAQDTGVRAGAAGCFDVPGTFAVHDLPDLGVDLGDLPRGDYVTVAGLILLLLGHLPRRYGERVQVGGWTLEVTEVAHHAITAVRLCPSTDRGAAP